ncbi:MAG: hypothetical protein ACTSV6_00750 [Candidatus Heimdallarchaeota archaeon]
MNKERVILNGFLIDVEVPSEERMAIRIDITHTPTHLTWISEVQDLLATIDQEYREKYSKRKSGRGRSVRVRYTKTAEGTQMKIAEFHPYPSFFINKLKELRKQIYELLNTYCLILSEQRVGRMIRKVYFLPMSLVPQLMNEIDQRNKKLAELNQLIQEYEQTDLFMEVHRLLKKIGVERTIHVEIPPVRVAPVPLSLSRKFFEEYLEEEAKKALKEIDEKKKHGLELLHQELERRRKEMIEAINQNLKQKFVEFVQAAEQAVAQFLASGKSRKRISKKFEKLVQLAENVGAKEPFNALQEVFVALENQDVEAVASAVENLTNSLNVPVTDDPVENLKAVSNVLKKKSLLLLTID